MNIELIGDDRRPVRLACVDAFTDWPVQLPEEIGPFVAIVVADARHVLPDEIATFASRLLTQGVAYLCAWGRECERVHDVFDWVTVDEELSAGEQPLLMTTWHADEELAEVLWFGMERALPADELRASFIERGSVLAIVVGRDVWADEMRRLVASPDRLLEEAEAAERRRGV